MSTELNNTSNGESGKVSQGNPTSNESTTQLADIRPQIDAPIRVLIPLHMNAPPRAAKVNRDQYIRANAFSPAAFSSMKMVLQPTRLSKKMRFSHANVSAAEQDAQLQTAIRDYTVLAFSSRRAGKREVEASAYVSIAVILDNQGNFEQAMESYKRYLNICREMNDVVGEAVACNCIGVNCMLIASPPSDVGILLGVKDNSSAIDHLNKAVQYHMQHLNSTDNGGKFVAHTNLGLCFGMIGDISSAARHHQDALRVAIKMQTLYGQSIAVGNLGMLALIKGDHATSRTCFQQHLQLAQTLQDAEAEVNAWKLLAKLSSSEEKYTDSLENLEQARRVAAKEGFTNELKRILCLIGIARGAMGFSFHVDLILNELQSTSSNHV